MLTLAFLLFFGMLGAEKFYLTGQTFYLIWFELEVINARIVAQIIIAVIWLPIIFFLQSRLRIQKRRNYVPNRPIR